MDELKTAQPMASLVERVARAIATRHWRNDLDEYKEPAKWAEAGDAYDLTNNTGRWGYDEIARAAIEAMREPTDEMLAAGDETAEPSGKRIDGAVIENWAEVYTAMIDAALSSSERSERPS